MTNCSSRALRPEPVSFIREITLGKTGQISDLHVTLKTRVLLQDTWHN